MRVDPSYLEIGQSVLKALQGRTSGRELSVRMGHHPSRFSRWFSGETSMAWEDFARLCRLQELDLALFCRELLCYSGAPEDGAQLLRHVAKVNGLSPKRLARIMDRNERSIHHLMLGSARLSLVDLLKVLDRGPGLLQDFAAAFTGEESDQLEDPGAHPVALLFEQWISAVDGESSRRSLESSFSRSFNIPLEMVQPAVQALFDHGLLREVEGRVTRVREERNVSGAFILSSAQARFLTWLALNRFRGPDGTPVPSSDCTNVLAHRTLAVSQRAASRIQSSFLEFYGKVSEIIESDRESPKVKLKAFLFHFFDVGPVAKATPEFGRKLARFAPQGSLSDRLR